MVSGRWSVASQEGLVVGCCLGWLDGDRGSLAGRCACAIPTGYSLKSGGFL